MTKKEKAVLGSLFDAIQVLSPEQRSYMLGYGDGILAAVKAQKERESANASASANETRANP